MVVFLKISPVLMDKKPELISGELLSQPLSIKPFDLINQYQEDFDKEDLNEVEKQYLKHLMKERKTLLKYDPDDDTHLENMQKQLQILPRTCCWQIISIKYILLLTSLMH